MGHTIQVFEVSLTARKKYTVIMSARMMWFIKLDVRDRDKCTVLISDCILIGEKGFTQKLIRYIMFADKNDYDESSFFEERQSQFGKKRPEKEDETGKNRKKRSSSTPEDGPTSTDDDQNKDHSLKRI